MVTRKTFCKTCNRAWKHRSSERSSNKVLLRQYKTHNIIGV